MALVEKSLDRGGPMAAFLGWRRDRMHREPAAPTVPAVIRSAPAIRITPVTETPPHIETDLDKTAAAMREIVKCAILDLSRFPSGTHFKDVVWYDTHKNFSYGRNSRTGEEPRRGKIYAVVMGKGAKGSNGEDKGGEMEVRRAGGIPNAYGEYDLNSAESHRATDQEVIDYAEAIMITIKHRLEEARIKAIVDFRPENKLKNSEDTNCLTTDLVDVDVAIAQLSSEKTLFSIRNQQPAA